MIQKLERLADLAELMQLSPSQAVALPASISVGAKSVDMTEEVFLTAAEENFELRDYLAEVCKRAIGQMGLRLV